MLCVNDIHTLFCGSTQVHMLVYVCVCVRTHSCRHTFFRNELHRDLEVIVHPCISLQWIKHCWALCFHRIVRARDVNQGPRRESAQCLIWTTLLCLHRGFFITKEEEVFIELMISLSGSCNDENKSREERREARLIWILLNWWNKNNAVFVGQDVLEINSFSKVW